MDMIGDLLYTQRRKKGLEIADAEQATGIRGVYLNALEQGEYEVLPGEVYVKGFIRNYGNFLGLDGTHLVHLYSESIAASAIQTTAKSVPAPVNPNTGFLTQYPFGKKTVSTLVVVLILVVSAWSLYAWQQSQNSTAAEMSRNNPATQTSPSSGSAYPSANYPTGVASSLLPTGSRSVVLVAHYSDKCWTSVIADGKTLYEGIPRIDETFKWEADRQIVVNFGNAAAVELTFNGQPVGKIGERGDVVVKTFTTSTTAPITPIPADTPTPTIPISPITPITPPTPSTPTPPNTPGIPPKPTTPTTIAPSLPTTPNTPGRRP